MYRREFMTFVAAAAAALPMAARAQTEKKLLIGVLMGFAEGDPNAQKLVSAFRETLTTLRWREGGNVTIEVRWGAGDPEKMQGFAKELVLLRPDVILAQTTPVLRAVARETQTIPIVFAVVSDPIGGGFAASITRPGGNVTGFTDAEPEMGGKWVQLLKNIAPRTEHMSLLFNPATAPPLKFYLPSIQAAGSSLGVAITNSPVSSSAEFENIIAAASKPGEGLIVMPDGHNTTHRDVIITLAARYKVPAIYFNRYFVQSGGLIGYGDDYAELFRQSARYVDRVLRGEHPGELPIQLPAKFELAVNLKTAEALGLDVPLTLVAGADEVIQ
jgi:putative ABC transport system substrate-binding protein